MLNVQFVIYDVLKKANGRKLAPHEIGVHLRQYNYKEVERILIRLANNFKNIHMEEKGLVRKFWWKD